MSASGFVENLLAQEHLPLPLCQMDGREFAVVLQTVCGYLNAGGGWIVIDGDEQVAKSIQKAVVEDISPLPLVYVQEEKLGEKAVVLVTVMKGNASPYTYLGRFYVMDGERPVQPDSDGMSILWRDSLTICSRWEEDKCLLAEEDDIDKNLLQLVYETGVANGRIRKSDRGGREVLSDLKLLRSSEVTNGVMALLGRDIRNILPQCKIRIQLMLNGKSAERYDDNWNIQGNIFDALQATMEYFQERLPKVSMFYADKTGRYDDFLYPLEVIDEAISNALIHRDYSDRMDEITVFVYSDRLEIANPGVLPDKIVRGKKTVLPHGSVLRNPLMAQVFFISGKMEKTGRGMMLISSKMKETGKRLPEWSCANGKTTLTIYNRSVSVQINGRVAAFLRELGHGRKFKRIEYMEFLKNTVSERTAKNDIALMVEGGWCLQEGRGPAVEYVRTAKKLPDIAW